MAPRARLATELAGVTPTAEATGHAERAEAAPGRRRLGPGSAAADH
ncbi:hypothetical protein [Streptomyces lavendulae]